METSTYMTSRPMMTGNMIWRIHPLSGISDAETKRIIFKFILIRTCQAHTQTSHRHVRVYSRSNELSRDLSPNRYVTAALSYGELQHGRVSA